MNHRQLACFAAGWLGLCGCLTVPLRAQAQLAEKTSQQIAELLAEKQSRTPAQMKLGSHLIYAARTMRGQRLTPHVAVMPLVSKSLRMRRDRVEVDLDGEITTSLIKRGRCCGWRD